MAKKERRNKTANYFDYNLLFLVIFLLCFGLVMLYSSSSYLSSNLYGDSAFYLKRQLRNIIIGFIPFTLFALSDYRIWKKFAVFGFVGATGLCAILLIPGVAQDSHGSGRWLQVGPIQFQPSEVGKFAIILFLAMLLERVAKKMNEFMSIVKVLVIVFPLIGCVAVTNLSTAIILAGIAVCMIFVTSPKYNHFIFVGIMGIAFIVIYIAAAGYRATRVQAWLHPETAGDDGYQTLQGLYAIGSGKLFGKGLGNSLQKLGNVPESQNDMIFTIICEELGLFGAICVILLFVLILWRMIIIANNAPDLFGSLIVIGVMSHIAIQVILNIAVVTNSIPNTGVILPFISYGGTSLAFLMGEVGMVLGVSKGIKLESIE